MKRPRDDAQWSRRSSTKEATPRPVIAVTAGFDEFSWAELDGDLGRVILLRRQWTPPAPRRRARDAADADDDVDKDLMAAAELVRQARTRRRWPAAA